jgi:hypothetical protein
VVPLLAVPALVAWGLDVAGNHPSIGNWLHIPSWVWKIAVFAGIGGVAYVLGRVVVFAWERLGEGYVEDATREREREGRPDSDQEEFEKRYWNSMGAVMVVSLLFAAANLPTWAFVASSFALGVRSFAPTAACRSAGT